jgi:hypothetical protein
MEIVYGAVAFVVLFATWVVVPTLVKKRHGIKNNEESGE